MLSRREKPNSSCSSSATGQPENGHVVGVSDPFIVDGISKLEFYDTIYIMTQWSACVRRECFFSFGFFKKLGLHDAVIVRFMR